MNVRGFGGVTKQKTLQALFSTLSPNMILLQEIIYGVYQSLLAFSKILPGWDFCALDSVGLLGCLLTGWNPHIVRCKDFETVGGDPCTSKF